MGPEGSDTKVPSPCPERNWKLPPNVNKMSRFPSPSKSPAASSELVENLGGESSIAPVPSDPSIIEEQCDRTISVGGGNIGKLSLLKSPCIICSIPAAVTDRAEMELPKRRRS